MPLTATEIITAAVSGGLGVKALEFLHEEWKLMAGERRSARKVVDRQLDPILKSADELVGKIRSLALEDFKGFQRSDSGEKSLDFIGTLYLFANFWSRLEILRAETEFVVLGATKKGRKLQAFIRALESTRIRLLSRTAQRAIGEALISKGDPSRSLSLMDFLEAVKGPVLADLLAPLKEVLASPEHTANRQKILGYGAVAHSLIDNLDPRHRVTRPRTGWGNKLSKRTGKELFFRVFRVYLPFVRDPARYTRPPIKKLSARRALANHQASDTLVGRLLARLPRHFRRGRKA